MDISTNASSRRSSFNSIPNKVSKYNQLFDKGARITPKDRIDSNIQAIKSLNLKISSGLAASYFFEYGSPQSENDHFKDVFKSFFVKIRGVDPLTHSAGKSLANKFVTYTDVCSVYTTKITVDEYGIDSTTFYSSTENLLEELQEIVHSTYGLRQQLLATLKQGKYTISDDWELETRDTLLREFIGLCRFYPKCIDVLKDVVVNLLEIEWLNEDVRGIQEYTGKSQNVDKPLVTANIWGGISVEGVLHLVKYTVGDGSCALHALLGKETPWCFYLEGSRAKLLSKIRERINESLVQASLINILQSHADAQNDASSNMLFEGVKGEDLKQQYRDLKRDYERQIATLKDSEAVLWLQEINSLRKLILENVDRSLERYTGKSNEEIFDIVKGSGTCLRNVIANNDSAFLNAILEEKRLSIYNARSRIVATLYKEDQAKADFFSQKLFSHYLTVLQNDDFYLNTAELELTAKLFNKNMRVIDRNGELITAVNIPNLQEAPVIIYHEGVHFSRCKPFEEANHLELESYKSRAEWAEIQELVGHALIRDGQLQTLHGIENWKEAYSLIAAGVLSIWLGGAPLAIQAARSGINIGGRQVDPEGKDKKIQLAKMLSNSAAGKFIGGGANLAASLGIDLVDILSRPENQNKTTSSIRSLIASSLKGIATKDPKKFAEYFMGGVVGEVANTLPENTKDTFHIVGVLKAFAQNPELQGKLVDGALKKVSRDNPKPKVDGDLTPEEQEKYPKKIITEIETEQIPKDTKVDPEMQDRNLYLRLLAEEKTLESNLKQAKDDLIHPLSVLDQAQKDLNEKQAKVDKYEKKGGNSAYEKWLGYKDKRDGKTIDRNVAQHNVNKVNDRVVEFTGKLEANRLAQADASAPKHINAPDPKIHIIADQKTREKHHPHYFENGQKQGLGKYDKAEDARHISGLFTKIETNKLSLEMQCFDAQGQLVEAGFSIDNIPKRPNLSMPTILGNDLDANSKTLNTAGVNHKKEVQAYLKGVETLLGKPIVTQGLSKSEISDIRKQVTPSIKDPKQHGFFFNAYRAPGNGLRKGLQWLDDHGVSLSVNVNMSTDLYKTNTKESTPSHVGNYGYDAPKKDPLSNMGQWENVQATQRDQMFERNMAYQSPVDNSSQGMLDYQQFWGQGLNPNAQIPPSDWSNLGRSDANQNISRNRQLLMAGFVPLQPNIEPSEAMHSLLVNDFTKSMPKGTAKVLAAVCTLMMPDMSDIKGAEDPKEHFKRAFNYGLKKYDQLVQINDPNSFGAKAGEFVGEMLALGGVGKVIRVAEGVSFFGMACEGGFMGALVSEAHDTNMVAGIAFGFVGGGVGAKLLLRGGGGSNPLIDRNLLRPEGFGQQKVIMRQIEGYVAERGLPKEFIAEAWGLRNAQSIKPMKLPSLQKGNDLKWFAENSPRIDHLKMTVPQKKFYKVLSKEFRQIEMNELSIRRTLNRVGFKTYPTPKSINHFTVELSDLSGGMIYRKAGTINKQNILVRVMPGKRNKNMVTSFSHGERPKWSLRQETPYVVQTKNDKVLTIDGRWVKPKTEDHLTHIPLELYKFKGWE